jgi:quercetin dioxygenase-like cupin family protein
MLTRSILVVGCQLWAASVCVAQTGAAQPPAKSTTNPAGSHIVRLPNNLQWNPLAGAPGAKMAVVSGDPDNPGAPFVIRILNPDGAKVPPHWHPTDEHITVLTGTFIVGMGRTFDLAGGQALTVGSYMLVPKEMPHFATAKATSLCRCMALDRFRSFG